MPASPWFASSAGLIGGGAIASAELVNAEGRPVALATGSTMYLPGRPASLAGVELAADDPEGAGDPDLAG